MQITDVHALTPQGDSALPTITSDEVWGALRARQLVPYFQPKIALKGLELIGVEALMRWTSPQFGLVCARSILPTLQDQALAEAVTISIIEMSLTQCRRWHDAGLNIQLSINLPAELLRYTDVVMRMEEQARSRGVDPAQIIVEVPEAAFAESIPDALDRLVEVRVRGFGLAVDDFGTGRCNREHLERIPASEMKVDRRMLMRAVRDPEARRQLSSTLNIAHELNLDTVMEGIETRDEWDLASELDCDFAQGFFIASPMRGDELLEWSSCWQMGVAHA